MNRTVCSFFMLVVLCCTTFSLSAQTSMSENPFYTEYDTPFRTPPFDKIKEAHYLPAFKEGITQQQKEIEAIASNPAPPTFQNTIVALERSGALLTKVSDVFFNLTGSNTNDNLQAIAVEVSPLLSKNEDDINLNARLFARVKAVYQQKGKLPAQPGGPSGNSYKDIAGGGSMKLPLSRKNFSKTRTRISCAAGPTSMRSIRRNCGQSTRICRCSN